jgi:vitamin B12 transporter
MKKLLSQGAVLIFLTALILAPSQLLAQTEDFLDILLVEGRRIEEKLSADLATYGHKVNVVQGETIEKTGMTDLSQVLMKLVPGLTYIPKLQADYSRFTLNGLHNILWLVDGIRINNRLYGSAYIDAIGLHNIERIEVLTGGEGLFHGTESTGGVINVITKKPGEAKFSGEVGASYGTFQTYDTYANFSTNAGGHKFMASASYDETGGYAPFKEETYIELNNPYRRHRKYDRLNIGLKYSHEFELSGYNNLFMSVQRNSGTFFFASANKDYAYNKRKEYIATLKWDHDVSGNYSYYVKGYFHNWWTDYANLDLFGKFSTNPPEALWGYQDWGVNFLNSMRWGRGNEILLGFDYQNYWGKDQVTSIDPKHEYVYAVFLQYRPHIPFWEDWKVALGARYNYMAGDEGSVGTAVWNISSLMPMLPDQALYFKTNIGTSFVLPTLDMLYYNDYGSSHLFGNPNLKPMSVLSLNAGFGGRSSMLDWDISGFFNEVSNQMTTARLPNGTSTYINRNGKTNNRGFTLEATLRPVKGLSLNGSYTKNYYQAYVSGDVYSSGKLSAQWDSQAGGIEYGIGAYSNYVGKRQSILSRFGTFDVGNYWLVDVRAYVKPTEKFTITLGLENIFNKHYIYEMSQVEHPPKSGSWHAYANPYIGRFAATLGMSYKF